MTNFTGDQLAEMFDDLPVGRGFDNVYPWNLSVDVSASTLASNPAVETREIDKANPTLVGFHAVSTASTNHAVGVRLEVPGYGTLVPRDDDADAKFVPMDANPVDANFKLGLEEGDDVTVKFINNDSSNSHFVKVILYIDEGDR